MPTFQDQISKAAFNKYIKSARLKSPLFSVKVVCLCGTCFSLFLSLIIKISVSSD